MDVNSDNCRLPCSLHMPMELILAYRWSAYRFGSARELRNTILGVCT